MGSIVLRSISMLLGIFFIFGGILKLTTLISKDLHKELRKEFVSYAKVFPFGQLLGIKVPAKWYRKVIGCLEISCGFAMAFIPKDHVKQIANIALIFLMALSVYSHSMVNDKFERMAPTLIFLFMLVGRIGIEWQVKRQAWEQNGEQKTQKLD